MRQTLFCAAVAIALSASTTVFENRASAQEPTEATADQADEASADTTDAATSQPADGQSTTESTASSKTATDQSATATDTTQDAATDATSPDTQPADAEGPLLPPPAGQPGAAATDSQRQLEPSTDQRQPAVQDQRPIDRPSDRIDASREGRSDLDVQARSDRGRDMQTGIRFSASTGRGLTIDTIERNSFFFDSGLRRGDVIVSLHGRPIRSEADFVRFVSMHPGQRVPVVVLRDGREETVYITYREDVAQADRSYLRQPAVVGGQPYLGVVFDARVPDAAVVHSVNPDSPAEHAGLQPGDEIVAINGERLRSHRDAIQVIHSMQPGERIDIDFSRRLDTRTQAVLDSQPGAPVRTATNPPEVRVEREIVPVPVPVYRDRDVDMRRDFDRDEDRVDRDRGYRGRGLLPRRRN